MRLGLNLGYWGSEKADGVALALEAERLGYHSIWTAEAYGSDAVTPLTWLAAKTERIHVGTAILQMPARTPSMTAMTAATLDLLTGGRVLLGLGVSGPQVIEGWQASPTASRWSARASTCALCAPSCVASSRSSTTASTTTSRCAAAPGSAGR